MSKFADIGKARAPATSSRGLDVSDFTPAQASERDPVIDQQIADRVATRRNMPAEAIRRVPLTRNAGLKDRIMVEGPLETLNRFRELSNQLGCTYHETMKALLDRYDEQRRDR
jgi:hypothetical protein